MLRLNGHLNFVIQDMTEYNRNSYLRPLLFYDSSTLTDTDPNLQHRNGMRTIHTNTVVQFGIVYCECVMKGRTIWFLLYIATGTFINNFKINSEV